jgi:hypothetical protein
MIDEYVFFQKGGEHITKGNRVYNQKGREESIAPEGNRVKYQGGGKYTTRRQESIKKTTKKKRVYCKRGINIPTEGRR